MSSQLSLSAELGPQFTLIGEDKSGPPMSIDISEISSESLKTTAFKNTFTITAGIKSSSLFAVQAPPVIADGVLSVVAAEDVGLYRAMNFDGELVGTTYEQLSRYAGLTLTAASTGNAVEIIRVGQVNEIGWNWTVGPVFIGPSGTLTQNPVSSTIRRIGWAVSATRINLDPFPIIGV